jgi:hypothetical protein
MPVDHAAAPLDAPGEDSALHSTELDVVVSQDREKLMQSVKVPFLVMREEYDQGSENSVCSSFTGPKNNNQ